MNQDEIKKLGLQLEDSPQVCLTLQEQEFPSHEKPRADVCMRVSAHVYICKLANTENTRTFQVNKMNF